LIGALGVVANLAIVRTRTPSIVKALIIVGISAVTFVVALAILTAVRGALSQS
jgi:hypothetical protein